MHILFPPLTGVWRGLIKHLNRHRHGRFDFGQTLAVNCLRKLTIEVWTIELLAHEIASLGRPLQANDPDWKSHGECIQLLYVVM